MPLRITLKPDEKMIIDGAVVRNGDTACNLVIENKVTILREKDILTEKQACTPCARIYFSIQLMYIDKVNLTAHHNVYWKLVRELVDAVPRLLPLVDQISEAVLSENYYQALKFTKKLIKCEEEIIQNERKRTSGICADEQCDLFRPRDRSCCSHESGRKTQRLPGQLA